MSQRNCRFHVFGSIFIGLLLVLPIWLHTVDPRQVAAAMQAQFDVIVNEWRWSKGNRGNKESVDYLLWVVHQICAVGIWAMVMLRAWHSLITRRSI